MPMGRVAAGFNLALISQTGTVAEWIRRRTSNPVKSHGTRCAGEVAAQADNFVCSVGVAYNARIGGVRMLDGDVTDSVEAQSLSLNTQHIHIYSASWGPDDDGRTVDGPATLARKAFYDGITKGRGGLGSIFVWASGNGGRDEDNCNCDGYTNSIFTLSISSCTEKGNVPWYSECCSSTLATTYSSGSGGEKQICLLYYTGVLYSEPCSSTLATTYSSGSGGEKQIVTTDLRKDCTETHTGTSASAPLAAGLIALALEANPFVTWRDMQHIVVETAKPDNLHAPDWVHNGAGKKVSHSFGFGLMDASAMVILARNWTTVPEQHICEIRSTEQNSLVPMNGKLIVPLYTDGCADTVNEVRHVEHVQARLTMTSSRRGEIQVSLTSPSQTRSVLLAKRTRDTSREGFNNWAFMTTHNWGESARGEWQLEIENGASSGEGLDGGCRAEGVDSGGDRHAASPPEADQRRSVLQGQPRLHLCRRNLQWHLHRSVHPLSPPLILLLSSSSSSSSPYLLLSSSSSSSPYLLLSSSSSSSPYLLLSSSSSSSSSSPPPPPLLTSSPPPPLLTSSSHPPPPPLLTSSSPYLLLSSSSSSSPYLLLSSSSSSSSPYLLLSSSSSSSSPYLLLSSSSSSSSPYLLLSSSSSSSSSPYLLLSSSSSSPYLLLSSSSSSSPYLLLSSSSSSSFPYLSSHPLPPPPPLLTSSSPPPPPPLILLLLSLPPPLILLLLSLPPPLILLLLLSLPPPLILLILFSLPPPLILLLFLLSLPPSLILLLSSPYLLLSSSSFSSSPYLHLSSSFSSSPYLLLSSSSFSSSPYLLLSSPSFSSSLYLLLSSSFSSSPYLLLSSSSFSSSPYLLLSSSSFSSSPYLLLSSSSFSSSPYLLLSSSSFSSSPYLLLSSSSFSSSPYLLLSSSFSSYPYLLLSSSSFSSSPYLLL
ncbi:hypothetical protein ACOMHN_037371 [Nucella lapillus]